MLHPAREQLDVAHDRGQNGGCSFREVEPREGTMKVLFIFYVCNLAPALSKRTM